VDGSNTLFWRSGHADADAPEIVVRALMARRFVPEIYFDHSIWRHLGQGHLDQLAALVEVSVVPRGTQADEMLLDASKLGRIQIVSNDRFRAWRGQHPKLRNDWLVTGSIGKGEQVNFSKKLRPAPL
jgi:hypothetical protein